MDLLGIPVNKGSLLSEVINITDNYLNSNQITPEQKQQAQQLYSEYLEQGGSQGDIEGFKEFVNKYNINQDLQNLHLTTPVLESLYENSSKSKDFITFVKDLKKMIAIWQNSGRTNEEILEMIKCL